MAYEDLKDLARRTSYDKVLCHKAFNSVNDPLYDGYQQELVSMFYNYFDKTSGGIGAVMCTDTANKANITLNQQFADELQKGITKRF